MKVDPRKLPQQGDTPDIWKSWYESLNQNFGKKNANSLFVKWWKMRGKNTSTTSEFREYLKKNGISISTSSWDDVVDAGSGVGDFFGDIFTVNKYLGMGLAVIVVSGIGLAVYNLARKPAESAGVAFKAYKGGM